MVRFMISCRQVITSLAVLCMFAVSAVPAAAQSPVKLKGDGAIDFSAEGALPFTLSGTASHLGRYTACGEVEFVPGDEEGSLLGDGVVVLEAANGDLLVGVVTWLLYPDGTGSARFHWRDSVEFSDGTVVSNTGRFQTARPPGAIIGFEYTLAFIILILSL